MKTEINITKYKFITQLQIVATIMLAVCLILAVIFEAHKVNILIYLGLAIIFIFLNRYIHEGCHYIIGRVQGFNCKIRFGLKMSECRVLGVQSYKQVIALSLAPLYVYLPAILFVLLSGITISLKFFILGVWGLLLGGMVGDFIYVYEALRNKTGKFTDTGHVLIIETE